jgi:calcium-dependent protein kinase
VLEAIAFCHKREVVHRDIKLENILLDSKLRFNVKLVGFHQAHKLAPGQRFSRMVGTSYYVAPEVLLHDYDQQCDMWSIGVVLFILLTGRPPFNGSDDKEIVRKVRRGHYHMDKKDFRKHSPACKEFVRRLLQVDPRSRMSAEDALRDPWIAQHRKELDINMFDLKQSLNNVAAFKKGQEL